MSCFELPFTEPLRWQGETFSAVIMTIYPEPWNVYMRHSTVETLLYTSLSLQLLLKKKERAAWEQANLLHSVRGSHLGRWKKGKERWMDSPDEIQLSVVSALPQLICSKQFISPQHMEDTDLLQHIHRRATETMQGMEHLPTTTSWETGSVQLEEEKAPVRPESSLSIPEQEQQERRYRQFSRVCGNRTKGNGFKLEEVRFRLAYKEKVVCLFFFLW